MKKSKRMVCDDNENADTSPRDKNGIRKLDGESHKARAKKFRPTPETEKLEAAMMNGISKTGPAFTNNGSDKGKKGPAYEVEVEITSLPPETGMPLYIWGKVVRTFESVPAEIAEAMIASLNLVILWFKASGTRKPNRDGGPFPWVDKAESVAPANVQLGDHVIALVYEGTPHKDKEGIVRPTWLTAAWCLADETPRAVAAADGPETRVVYTWEQVWEGNGLRLPRGKGSGTAAELNRAFPRGIRYDTLSARYPKSGGIVRTTWSASLDGADLGPCEDPRTPPRPQAVPTSTAKAANS